MSSGAGYLILDRLIRGTRVPGIGFAPARYSQVPR